MKSLLVKLAAAAVLLLLVMHLSNKIFNEEEPERLIYIAGRVRIQHEGRGPWAAAKEGMAVKDADRIKTSADSEAEITLDSTSKNIVRIMPATELILQDIGNKRVSMPKGEIMASIESLPEGSSFEVRTPTAVAGVLGSGISVFTDGEKTDVRCFEDRAYVRGLSSDGTPMAEIAAINEGYRRSVAKFAPPEEAVILTTTEIKSWPQFREEIHKHTCKPKGRDEKRDFAIEEERLRREAEEAQERHIQRMEQERDRQIEEGRRKKAEEIERRHLEAEAAQRLHMEREEAARLQLEADEEARRRAEIEKQERLRKEAEIEEAERVMRIKEEERIKTEREAERRRMETREREDKLRLQREREEQERLRRAEEERLRKEREAEDERLRVEREKEEAEQERLRAEKKEHYGQVLEELHEIRQDIDEFRNELDYIEKEETQQQPKKQ